MFEFWKENDMCQNLIEQVTCALLYKGWHTTLTHTLTRVYLHTHTHLPAHTRKHMNECTKYIYYSLHKCYINSLIFKQVLLFMIWVSIAHTNTHKLTGIALFLSSLKISERESFSSVFELCPFKHMISFQFSFFLTIADKVSTCLDLAFT